MADELSKAFSKIIYPQLKPEGFRRNGKRDLIRVENGIVQRLYVQLSHWGDRLFCVTACANLIAGNEHPTLQPGYRLADDDGKDQWLPSLTTEEAEHSADQVLTGLRASALPYFEKIRSLQGYAELLATERWGSMHHLCFERGMTLALIGDTCAARHQLVQAIQLYEEDGRSWCADYIARAGLLLGALEAGSAAELLGAWEQANKRVHGVA